MSELKMNVADKPLCVCVFTQLSLTAFILIPLCFSLLFMQEVLTQLTSRLASQLNDLTIQVVKDDWSFPRPSPNISSSPLIGSYNSRTALSTSPPSVYPSHIPSTQSQLVGGVGQVKGHPHIHSPSSSPHHHDNTSPTLVTPHLHTPTSHLQT